jgi:hypothetical protein
MKLFDRPGFGPPEGSRLLAGTLMADAAEAITKLMSAGALWVTTWGKTYGFLPARMGAQAHGRLRVTCSGWRNSDARVTARNGRQRWL